MTTTALNYTDPALTGAAWMSDAPRSGRTVSGYGARIPTGYVLEYDGHPRRVYAVSYGNAASLYVNVKGARVFLSSDAEHDLQAARESGATAAPGVWFLWFGGGSYTPGYVDDAEHAASVAAVLEVCADRYRNADGRTPAVEYDRDDYGRGTAAHVWMSDPRGNPDPYPDAVVTIGPRGGWRVDPA